METYIYTLSDSSGIKYVGKSNDPLDRLKSHLKDCKKKRTRKERWIHGMLERNELPVLEIIDHVPNNMWSFYESYWISQLKAWGFDLVNGTEGGEGSNGFKGKTHTKETIEKCRSARYKRESETSLTGSNNGNSKLDESKVIEIKKMLDQKISHTKIATIFKVSKVTITHISTGKKWKHVK